MDQRVVHKLIDYGFQVGLHGHQHHPGAAPFALNLPNRTSIVVVGAGSFAVGDRELPRGERRQFNIVQINQQDETVTVHVRAMSSSGVFARSHRDDFGGNAYITLPLPPTKGRREVEPLQSTALADDVIAALGERRYDDAIALASRLDDPHANLQRRAKITAYEAPRGIRQSHRNIGSTTAPGRSAQAGNAFHQTWSLGCRGGSNQVT